MYVEEAEKRWIEMGKKGIWEDEEEDESPGGSHVKMGEDGKHDRDDNVLIL